MKPAERLPPDDPREWMNRARSNLALARVRSQEVYLEDLCFELQQAAEKAIKAVMLSRGIEPPYIHDLASLLSTLEDAGEQIPTVVRRAARLTAYAVEARYPALKQPLAERDYAEAVEITESILSWAEQSVRSVP